MLFMGTRWVVKHIYPSSIIDLCSLLKYFWRFFRIFFCSNYRRYLVFGGEKKRDTTSWYSISWSTILLSVSFSISIYHNAESKPIRSRISNTRVLSPFWTGVKKKYIKINKGREKALKKKKITAVESKPKPTTRRRR